MEIIYQCPDCEQYWRLPVTEEYDEYECVECGSICDKVKTPAIPEEKDVWAEDPPNPTSAGLFESLENDRLKAKRKEEEDTNRFFALVTKGGAYFIVGGILLTSKFYGFQSAAGASISVIFVAGLACGLTMDFAERKRISPSTIFLWIWIACILSILIFKP